jgi:hypothetical protein
LVNKNKKYLLRLINFTGNVETFCSKPIKWWRHGYYAFNFSIMVSTQLGITNAMLKDWVLSDAYRGYATAS